MKKSIMLVVLVLAAALLAACGAGEAETVEANQQREVPVEVTAAYQGELKQINTYQGSIRPEMDVNVVPKIGGRVAMVNVKVSDKVRAGDLLLKLDTTEIAAQVAQAEAGYQVALAQLEKVKAGTRTEQIEQLEAGVKQAEAGVQNAENALETAQANFDRMQVLYEQGAISQQQFEQAESGLKSAQIGLETAKAARRQAEEALKMARNGATAEDVKSVEAQVAQAKAAVSLARTQLDNAVITAPIGGTVSSLAVDPGEMAGPSMPVAVINKMDKVLVEIGLTEKDVNRVREGQTVEVLVSAASQEPLTGKVTTISPVADPRSKTYAVKVELDNQDGILKPGMSAAVKIAVDTEKASVIVPVEAILTRGEQQVVFVVEDGTAKMREVELGLDNGQEVSVTTGLSAGDKVVIAGQHNLENDSRVTIAAGGSQ